MAKGLIQHIAAFFKSYHARVLLVENNDRFLYRDDVIASFALMRIEICKGNNIEQRVKYELREPDEHLVLFNQNNSAYLEDIKKNAIAIECSLDTFLPGYHIPTIIEIELPILDKLLENQQLVKLNKSETIRRVKQIEKEITNKPVEEFNVDEFVEQLDLLLTEKEVNWSVVSRFIANGILCTIGTPRFEELQCHINRASNLFQAALQTSYHQTKNSSAAKKPRIVSKILDYLSFHYRDKKLALIVVDGMALWQYELLRDQLPGKKQEEVIYSWLPSITQLSRQAIFRGDSPKSDYRQAPVSEEKLWRNYWKRKGCSAYEVAYQHEHVKLENIGLITKLAIVLKDLDDKMHGSTDYSDLLMLTRNWVERSGINRIVEELLLKGFTVFLTSDHGNIQAKGWRGLTDREKLGTHKSGSKSTRHIEYDEKWLWDEFIRANPDLQDSIAVDEQAIYLKSDLSFSNKDSLVTHGGSHLLEMLIPFIEIKNDPKIN